MIQSHITNRWCASLTQKQSSSIDRVTTTRVTKDVSLKTICLKIVNYIVFVNGKSYEFVCVLAEPYGCEQAEDICDYGAIK